jgi:hypothetical protein
MQLTGLLKGATAENTLVKFQNINMCIWSGHDMFSLSYVTVVQMLILFYTGNLGIVVFTWLFLNHTGFPFAVQHRYGNLAIAEFLSKWVKVMLPYRGGGDCCLLWGVG